MVPQQLTTANKILVAAAQLDADKETFTAEDLIVQAWSRFPESFGLSGYGDRYPDSNRVLAKLMGAVGLCNRGWLEQVSTKTYRMTTSGRKYASALVAGVPADEARAALAAPKPEARAVVKEKDRERPRQKDAPPPVKARKDVPDARLAVATKAERTAVIARAAVKAAGLQGPVVKSRTAPTASAALSRTAPAVAKPAARAPRVAEPDVYVEQPPPAVPFDPESKFEDGALVQRLMTSVASQKWTRAAPVTFADACAFWGASPSIHPGHLGARLDDVDSALKRAAAYIQGSRASIRINDRLEASLATVIGLQGLHRTMMQKYHREIESIRARAEAK